MAIIELYKYIKESAILGWKLDSNWTDPTLFAIYYMIRPLSGLLIVGFMYIIVSAAGGSFNPQYFAFLFLGSTFFVYMTQLCQTMSMLIPEEKARYESMRQVYISPSSIKPYIIGRTLAAVFDSTIAVIIAFVLGDLIFTFLFKQPLAVDFFTINFPTLLLSVILGIVGMIGIGYMLSGVSLVSNRLQWNLNEYVNAIFLLLGGVWFPPSLLPSPLPQISYALPVTWFLNAVRESMVPGSTGFLLYTSILYLAISSVATLIVAYYFFTWCESYARQRGIIDRKAEA